MQVTTVGIDLAKNIFHVHGVGHTGRIVFSKPLRRAQMAEFFVGLPPCLIGMEACSGAHFWARKLQSQGHDVRLMSPQFVKPYVKSNKNDRADAQAICEAVSRPSMRFVAVKSCEQQAVLAVHRARQGFVKMRTALANQIRGLLSEFGIVMAQGLRVVLVQAGAVAADERMALPSPMRTLIGHLHQQLKQLDAQVAQLEQLIASSVQADSAERRLQQVPGIGPITSSAIVATVGDATLFANGKQLAAWLGLVPRQHSSGGKDKLLGISKRGDGYVRTLLIHGARSLIQANERRRAAGKSTDAWLDRLLSRRNANVAAVALANRNARILWAMLVKASEYRPEARMLAAV
jgi:transposase